MKVFVNLTSTVTDDSHAIDTLPQSRVSGMLKKDGSMLRLSFPLDGKMQTLIFEDKNKGVLELRRENGYMLFDRQTTTEGLYKVEHFSLLPKIKTHRLSNGITEEGGKLILDYTLDFEGEKQHFHMEIEVKPAL